MNEAAQLSIMGLKIPKYTTTTKIIDDLQLFQFDSQVLTFKLKRHLKVLVACRKVQNADLS